METLLFCFVCCLLGPDCFFLHTLQVYFEVDQHLKKFQKVQRRPSFFFLCFTVSIEKLKISRPDMQHLTAIVLLLYHARTRPYSGMVVRRCQAGDLVVAGLTHGKISCFAKRSEQLDILFFRVQPPPPPPYHMISYPQIIVFNVSPAPAAAGVALAAAGVACCRLSANSAAVADDVGGHPAARWGAIRVDAMVDGIEKSSESFGDEGDGNMVTARIKTGDVVVTELLVLEKVDRVPCCGVNSLVNQSPRYIRTCRSAARNYIVRMSLCFSYLALSVCVHGRWPRFFMFSVYPRVG